MLTKVCVVTLSAALLVGCAPKPLPTTTPATGESLRIRRHYVKSGMREAWRAYQGEQRINAEAFCRIVGDEEALARIERDRRTNRRYHRWSGILAISGLATLGASAFVGEESQAMVASMGTLAASLGGYLWFITLNTELHSVPIEHALERSNGYNHRTATSRAPSLGVRGSF
jgi:hypothetical protein